jgi:hypothetical protein
LATEQIEKNLERVLQCLAEGNSGAADASAENDTHNKEQFPAFNSLEISSLASTDEEEVRDLQEAHLVWEQLQWLFSLSGKMLELAPSLQHK